MDPVIDTLEAPAQLGYPARQRRSRLRVAAYIGEVHMTRLMPANLSGPALRVVPTSSAVVAGVQVLIVARSLIFH